MVELDKKKIKLKKREDTLKSDIHKKYDKTTPTTTQATRHLQHCITSTTMKSSKIEEYLKKTKTHQLKRTQTQLNKVRTDWMVETEKLARVREEKNKRIK